MIMRLGAAIVLGTLLGSVQAANAQHVVTEAEAGKLTLEALTAAPPPPRPIYRSYVHQAMITHRVHERLVRRAAWHPAPAHRRHR